LLAATSEAVVSAPPGTSGFAAGTWHDGTAVDVRFMLAKSSTQPKVIFDPDELNFAETSSTAEDDGYRSS
jgi:hypothetical protein